MRTDTMSVAELAAMEKAIKIAKAKKQPRTPADVAANVQKRMKIHGKEVLDAADTLPVKITKDDVRRGATKKAESCAAARAICREGGFTEARVHVARTYVRRNDGTWLRFATPPNLGKEIVAFDRGGSFEPGEYTLTPIQPSQKMGQRAKRKNLKPKLGPHRRPNGAPRPYHVTTGIRSRFLPE